MADQELTDAISRISQVTHLLSAKSWASPEARLSLINLRCYAQELYKIQFQPWSLKQYQQLDPPLTKFSTCLHSPTN
jgi:hypothetical protein